MNHVLSKMLFRAWPFSFAHVRLMGWLDPPAVPEQEVTTALRRYGLKISYDPNTYIGRFLYYRGLFEEQILKAIEDELAAGSTFIDIGGNIGVHTVVAAQLVGPLGHVVVFEPGQAQRDRLIRNVRDNLLVNVEIHSTALGRYKHTARLYSISTKNDGQSTLAAVSIGAPSEEVAVETLDGVMRDRVVTSECVMKIDVEGAEMDVLEGATQFISRVRPKAIFVEVVDEYLRRFETSSESVVRFLRDHGYCVKGLIHGRWRQIDSDFIENLDVMATICK